LPFSLAFINKNAQEHQKVTFLLKIFKNIFHYLILPYKQVFVKLKRDAQHPFLVYLIP